MLSCKVMNGDHQVKNGGWLIIAALCIAGAIALGAVGMKMNAERSAASPVEAVAVSPVEEPEDAAPNLSILSLQAEQQGSAVYATGEVRNMTERVLRDVAVDFLVYDAQGRSVGTASARIAALEPGAVWSFRAPSFRKDANEFKVHSLRSR
jgi:hypothetical protein